MSPTLLYSTKSRLYGIDGGKTEQVTSLHPRGLLTIRHPGQVRLRRTRAGIQKEFDYIELSLDSGYPPPADSGMTQS